MQIKVKVTHSNKQQKARILASCFNPTVLISLLFWASPVLITYLTLRRKNKQKTGQFFECADGASYIDWRLLCWWDTMEFNDAAESSDNWPYSFEVIQCNHQQVNIVLPKYSLEIIIEEIFFCLMAISLRCKWFNGFNSLGILPCPLCLSRCMKWQWPSVYTQI